MRRLIAIFALALLVPALVVAQNTGQESLQSWMSYGVFQNELDAALSVDETGFGPGFTDLESKYLFGGIANINRLENRDGTASGLGAPIWLGMYMPGQMPWSLFAGLHFSDFTQADPAITYPGTTPPKPVDGTDYEWEPERRENVPKAKAFKDADARAQFLTSLAGLNTGIYLRYYQNDDAVYNAGTNFVETESFYYDADSGDATVPPDVTLGYATTDENTTYDGEGWVSFGIPLFLTTGDMAHLVNVNGMIRNDTYGSIDTFTYSDFDTDYPNNVADPNYQAINRDVRTEGNIDAGVEYTLTLPGLLDKGDRNEFSAMVDAGIVLKTLDLDIYEERRDLSYTAGSAETDQLQETTTTTATTGMALGFNVDLTASHSFYYELADSVTFGLIPAFEVGFQSDPLYPYLEQTVTVNKVDGGLAAEDDGEFNSANDSVDTTTTTYTNWTYDALSDTGQAQETTNTLSTAIRLPVSVMVKPEGWVFGLTVGAEPEVTYDYVATTVAPTTSTVIDETADGTGADVAPADTITDNPTTVGYTSVTHDWGVRVDHLFGLNFEFAGGVKADVRLNFSDFVDFDEITAQVIVPLPAE